MPSIDGTELPYVNPLGASDASDWEHYQGCATPMIDGYQHTLQQYRRISELEKEKARLEDEVAELKLQAAAKVQAETRHPLYGSLPTEDKARKRLQLWTFLMEYFPDTFLAVVEVAIAGNEQHNPGQPLHWAREKSKDQLNPAFRHQWDYGRGVKKDTDGQWHLAKAIWRLSAQLQLDIEEERRKNGDK